ncbi:hypothetical protein [Rhodopirellula baltica]|uniref:Uncharacterized protein n=1 Tax=Rhodopirellula baltica WH47 TaxID=991778 RepID=F2AUH5_RHOBT|nr:hypothetical protein [Rhodopirellula baltica]EGF26742.1 hypothetical protein RBWH47_00367 [Rhodopirellula baltica WH47]
MTRPTKEKLSGTLLLTCVVAAFSVIAGGCAPLQLSALKMPSMKPPKLSEMSGLAPGGGDSESRFDTVGSGAMMTTGTFNEEVYHKVREAKANSSIVLQIVGDQTPVRVLPLPPASGATPQGPSVFVSTLLKQTGVDKRFGRMEAVLYRHSTDSVEGHRMEVQFADRGAGDVRPESDYALRAGDRLVVRESQSGGISSLVDIALQR